MLAVSQRDRLRLTIFRRLERACDDLAIFAPSILMAHVLLTRRPDARHKGFKGHIARGSRPRGIRTSAGFRDGVWLAAIVMPQGIEFDRGSQGLSDEH
jgi:hypothetical protein